ERLRRVPMGFLGRVDRGRIATLITNDTLMLDFQNVPGQVAAACVQPLYAAVILAVLDWRLAAGAGRVDRHPDLPRRHRLERPDLPPGVRRSAPRAGASLDRPARAGAGRGGAARGREFGGGAALSRGGRAVARGECGHVGARDAV